MNKRAIFTISLLILGVASVSLLAVRALSPPNHTPSTEERALRSVISEFPGLTKEGKPFIAIQDIEIIEEKWYIINIRSHSEPKVVVPVYLIFYDDGGENLRLILGPDTHFTETEMLQYNIPDSIIRKFQTTGPNSIQ